jgi:hypothetical protein
VWQGRGVRFLTVVLDPDVERFTLGAAGPRPPSAGAYFGSSVDDRRRSGGPDSNLQTLGSAAHGYCPGDSANLFTVSVQDDRVKAGGRVELLVIGARGPKQINARWLTKKVSPGDRDLVKTDRLRVRGHRAFVRAPASPAPTDSLSRP